MIITPLGHTEFLVDIANNEGERVRILVDSWLSDYAIGDLMERTVKVRLDPVEMSTIDAIYISHSHSDHFDPYTLMEIFGNPFCKEGAECSEAGRDFSPEQNPQSSVMLQTAPFERSSQKPLLILPFTLRYLEPLLSEFLPHVRVKWLDNKETYLLKGIEITGYMWAHPMITNEDDVMMLAISSAHELLFAEIDSVPDREDEEVQKSLHRVFTRKKYETACYIASRNHLEGLIPLYDTPPLKRRASRDRYVAEQKVEIQMQYELYDYEEYAHFPSLYTLPGYVRGYVGQGIAYPQSLSDELYSLPIFPLDALASIESDYASNAGYSFPQKALLPGRQYKIENGNIETGRKECPIGTLVRHSDEGRIQSPVIPTESPISVVMTRDPVKKTEQDFSSTLVPRASPEMTGMGGDRIYASGPLFPRIFIEDEITLGKEKILEILNTRFLPYWSASSIASLRDALVKNNGTYRISFRTPVIASEMEGSVAIQVSEKTEHGLLRSSQGRIGEISFEYSTARSGFIEVPYEASMKIDEDYYLSDILDFFDGRQEMYSSFWHRLDPKRVYRLWTCLGTTYMNHDLALAKYRLHFERARSGLTATSFVEEVLDRIRHQ